MRSCSSTAIEGRVIRKSEIFTYANGTEKFLTFDLADLSSEIRCKAFNAAADMFIDKIVLGNVFSLTNHFDHNTYAF